MTKHEKALLDLIAWAEGTLGVSQNGYDVTFNFYRIKGWTNNTDITHEGWEFPFGNKTTTAVGRYQFRLDTWKDIWGGKNKPLTKENQDEAALKLIQRRFNETDFESRKVSIYDLETRDKFDIMMNKLAREWASFVLSKDISYQNKRYFKGRGFYDNQGKDKTVNDFYEIYKQALSKYN